MSALKVIGINGSPRTSWNTAMMVKKTLEGAASLGAKTEYVDLSKIKFRPCLSCLECKRGPPYEGKCHMKDGLTPILESIKKCDALVIGTPVYFGLPSGLVHGFLDRLWFSNYAYATPGNLFGRKIKTGLIFTMNCPEKLAIETMHYDQMYNIVSNPMKMVFGENKVLCSYNTQQVDDYSKYRMDMFDPKDKYASHKIQFPKDLENAFKFGQELATK